MQLNRAAREFHEVKSYLKCLHQGSEDAWLKVVERLVFFSEASGGPAFLPRQAVQIKRDGASIAAIAMLTAEGSVPSSAEAKAYEVCMRLSAVQLTGQWLFSLYPYLTA